MNLRLPFWAILLIPVLPGCGGSSPGVGVHSRSWSVIEPDRESVPGIDDAQVMIGNLGNSPAVIIWSDCNGSFGGQSTGSGDASFDGTLYPQDGRQVTIGMKLQSEQQSNISIDGQLFDPALGRLFLVSTAENKTRVQQLNRTLPSELLTPKSDDAPNEFQAFAKEDADIKTFFSKSK